MSAKSVENVSIGHQALLYMSVATLVPVLMAVNSAEECFLRPAICIDIFGLFI